MMKWPSFLHNRLFDIALLAFLLALFFGISLGERPYSAPSEARYVEIGREMAESGDFITPRLNYVKYFEKPPLFYWAQALWTKYAGLDFFHARVPTAACAILLCLLTYSLGGMLYGRLAGLLSAGVMATSLYLFALSRIVLVDVPVSVFLVATLSAFLYVVNAPEGRRRTWGLYAMYIAAAGAVLTKGLIGAVLPGAVIFLWLAMTGKWSLLAALRIPTGALLFLAFTVPWHVLVWLHNPEHPHFYFIHEHWERFTSKVHKRYHPFWYFFAVLPAGLFPWLAFAPQAVKIALAGCWRGRRENGNTLFLAIWVVFIFLFFSMSDSKLIPYILPIFPPIAAWIGRYLALWWQESPEAGKVGTRAGLLLTIIALLLMTAAPLVLQNLLSPDSKAAQAIVQGGAELGYLSTVSLVAAVVLFIVYIQGRARHVVMTLLIIAGTILELGDGVANNYDKDSMQGFAATIRSVIKPGDEVASYDNYYQDLPIYLKRRITVVEWWKEDTHELNFGALHEDTSTWMTDYAAFWKRWMDPRHRMFVVMRLDAYDRIKAQYGDDTKSHMHLLQQSGRDLLFTNLDPATLTRNPPPWP